VVQLPWYGTGMMQAGSLLPAKTWSVAGSSPSGSKRTHHHALPAFHRKAVELARTVSPTTVITLEEEWGDWLSAQKQMDAAINHYIEAGCTIKAIEAAIADRQCAKAAGIVEFLEPAKAAPYYRRIAQQYEDANNRCGSVSLGGGACVSRAVLQQPQQHS